MIDAARIQAQESTHGPYRDHNRNSPPSRPIHIANFPAPLATAATSTSLAIDAEEERVERDEVDASLRATVTGFVVARAVIGLFSLSGPLTAPRSAGFATRSDSLRLKGFLRGVEVAPRLDPAVGSHALANEPATRISTRR